MTESAEGLLEFTDKGTANFHEKVAAQARKARHFVTAADVNPSHDSHFDNIMDFIGKTSKHAASEATGDQGSSVGVETAPGNKIISFMKERARKKAV